MNSILALGAKALTMVISLVCGVLTTRLVLGDAGVEYYALFSMLTSLPSLLSFTDLGAGAVVVNGIATSDDIRTDRTLAAQLTSVERILVGFAAVTMLVNTVLLLTGGWTIAFGVTGELPGADLAAFVCLTIFCLGVPVGIWVRIMLGLRRNHLIILLQGLISPLTLLGVWMLLTFGTADTYAFLATSSYVASFLVGALGLGLTAYGTRPLVPRAAAMVLHPRRHPGVRVMDVGWPMLAQLLSYPVAVSTQRYVLAQWGTHQDVAEYGVAGQVFFALNGLVVAAGLALWPMYARRRHRGELRRGPFLLAGIFAAGVGAATVFVALVGPWVFDFITDGTLEVRTTTILAFGLMVTCTAGLYPLGMFIMDKPGIRFQVVPTLLMALASLALSIVLTPAIGTAGPPLGNAVAVVVFQVIPFSWYIIRHRARLLGSETASAPEEPQPEDGAGTDANSETAASHS
ncbi:hypothetical protein ACI7YT_16460 [Microbacterium sp. M]|uniref:hypothetical protein n=1 Tax=Microbacterium sp. M TaxID=3377125 RepID=UPI00386C8E1F